MENLVGLMCLKHRQSLPSAREVYKLRCVLDGIEVALTSLLGKNYVGFIFTESEVVGEVSDGAVRHEAKEENFSDYTGAPLEEKEAGRAEVANYGQRSALTMERFLCRPVEVYKAAIAIGGSARVVLDVWSLFFANPSIRAKIRNFAYFRGDLKVRIVISGTPFHYGRLLVSYQPLATVNSIMSYFTAAPTGTASYRNLLNYLSQAPGSFVMNVNENATFEFSLPFILPKPMARLFNTSAVPLAAASSFDDIDILGDLYIQEINPVKCVSASPTPAYMQVYAWVEDAELGTSTATQLVITTESGKDERETGPVERVASRVAGIAAALSSVPVIGQFAKASSMIAGAVAGVASLFGWSKPVLLAPAHFVKNEPYRNGANTVGDETLKRIVLDPKQELSVSPAVVGTENDDMTLKALWSRPSYIGTFTWHEEANIMVNPIFTCAVSPSLVTSAATVPASVVPSAMAFCAAPFSFWRGDLVFRFEIVVSKFHRGKLAIFWEPNISQSALINAGLSLNKNYMVVVDIQETQTFDVCIKWGSARPWLKVSAASSAPVLSSLNSVGDISVIPGSFANGYIGVVPFTALQSPDTSDVEVNVYVMGEDMHFNGLSTTNLPTGRVISTESETLMREVSCLELNASTASTQHINEDCFGEEPLSFRALLKRYITVQSTIIANSGSDSMYTMTCPILFPSNMPFSSSGFTLLDLLSYLRYSYVGLRGGIRYRLYVLHAHTTSPLSQSKVSFSAPNTSQAAYTVTSGTPAAIQVYNVLNGTVSFVPSTNGGIEFELPMYTNNLFLLPMSSTWAPSSGDVMETLWYRNFVANLPMTTTGSGSTYLQHDFATAEDFSLMRFQGATPYSY